MKKLPTLLLAGVLAFTVASVIGHAQEAAGEKSDAAKKEEGGDMTAWKWANFAVLAGGLGYLVAKNAGPFFAARSQAIRREMADAEEIRREAEERANAVSRKLAALQSEVEEMRRQSKAEAEAEAERMARRTAAEIAKVRAQGEAEIVAAGKAARAELKRYTAHLAVSLAEQKVRARMNPGTQEALVRGFVHDLADPAARAQAN